jgi:glycosyltransferase involved in cell wall biosynthesis
MPKVSVIIPTYNRAHFIAEAIQSVLDQTYQDFEMIVVDDGSTDITKDVVDSFKDLRIKYIYQENRKLPTARNTGISASTGEYIALLDSDDALLENALEKGVRVLDRHPEVGLSYGQKYKTDEKGHIFALGKPKHRSPGVYRGTKEILNLLRYGNYIAPSMAMVRRSSIIDVGLFDTTLSSGSEDFELWVRIAKKYAVAYIAEPVGKYRVSIDSISVGRNLNEQVRTHRRIYAGLFKDSEVGHLLSSQRPKAYFHLYLRFASYAYGRRDMKTARRYLFRVKMYLRVFIISLWLPWIIQFGKTWIPIPVLSFVRKVKLYLMRAIRYKSKSNLK